MTISSEDVLNWMERWSQAIREQDFEAGRRMFVPEVVAFGSLADHMIGIDQLVEEQWSKVWVRTRNFTFGVPLRIESDGDLAVVVVDWTSQGDRNGQTYPRSGRATLVLRRSEETLLCVHTHFSMHPGEQALQN